MHINHAGRLMFRQVFPLLCCFLALGCQSPDTKQPAAQAVAQKTVWQPPAPGTVVDRYQERITEDKLNEKYFRVSVLATDRSKEGHFNLKLEYGFNINEVEVDLPQWTGGAVLKPLLQKGAGTYHCILGFDAGDGRFRELYEIKAENGDVRMKQIRGYYMTR